MKRKISKLEYNSTRRSGIQFSQSSQPLSQINGNHDANCLAPEKWYKEMFYMHIIGVWWSVRV